MRTPLFFPLALLLGCTPAGTFTVSSDGADIELPGGASLSIPPGAVDEDVQITATLITDLVGNDYASAPDYADEVPFAIALEPHGLQFNEPATLSLPFLSGSGPVILRTDDGSDSTWEAAGRVTTDGDVAQIAIAGFSGYALTFVPDGTCECFDQGTVAAFFAAGQGLGIAPLAVFDATQSQAQVVFQRDSDGHYGLMVGQDPDGMCGIGAAESGTQPGPLWDAFFPGLTPQQTSDQLNVSATTGQSSAACVALLRAGAEGALAAPWSTTVTGLTSGSLTLQAGTRDWIAGNGVTDHGLLPRDEEVTINILPPAACVFEPTAGVMLDGSATAATFTPLDEPVALTLTCTATAAETCNGIDDDGDGDIDEDFDTDEDGVTTCGADGTAGNADDDCDDTEPTVYPGADEICDDGNDNDCDGAPVADETTDGDGDGVPDACDTSPATVCDTFTLAQVETLLAESGAQCFVDTTGAAIPAPLQGDADAFTGVFIEWTADAWEVAGAGPVGTDWFAAFGCSSDTTTYCADNARPLLPADSLVTQVQHDACNDVAAYACR